MEAHKRAEKMPLKEFPPSKWHKHIWIPLAIMLAMAVGRIENKQEGLIQSLVSVPIVGVLLPPDDLEVASRVVDLMEQYHAPAEQKERV